MLNDLGIVNAVSPQDIVASKIVSYIRAISNKKGSNVLTLYKLVNNLDEKGTASFFKTINTFISFGSLEDINNSIGGTFANAMIGNEENTGFAYSLKDVGATDFTFQNIDETNMFIIQK